MSRRRKNTRKPLDGGTLKTTFHRSNFIDEIDESSERLNQIERLTQTTEALKKNFIQQGRQQVFDGWAQQNVTASQSAVTLDRFGYSTLPLRRAVAGSLTRIEVAANEDWTAGSLTIEAYVAGVASGFQAIINEEDKRAAFEIASVDEYTYAAGDAIELKITTSAGFTPTTMDIWCTLHLSET